MILEKIKVRRSFSAASATYDSAAELQRSVGKALLGTIDTALLSGTILDLGCGTGFLTGELLGCTPCNPLQSVIALDIAWSMLQTTRNKLNHQEIVRYICADAEHLPVAGHTIDQIFSNLALQWCRHLDVVFADSKRVLKTGGRLVFSTFGPATLQELKAAWATVDDYNHVNAFYSGQQLRDFLQQAGFKDIRLESRLYTSRYDSVLALMRELKQLGAHNVIVGRNRQITSKSAMQRMIAAYENQCMNGRISATFEVIMVSAKA